MIGGGSNCTSPKVPLYEHGEPADIISSNEVIMEHHHPWLHCDWHAYKKKREMHKRGSQEETQVHKGKTVMASGAEAGATQLESRICKDGHPNPRWKSQRMILLGRFQRKHSPAHAFCTSIVHSSETRDFCCAPDLWPFVRNTHREPPPSPAATDSLCQC